MADAMTVEVKDKTLDNISHLSGTVLSGLVYGVLHLTVFYVVSLVGENLHRPYVSNLHISHFNLWAILLVGVLAGYDITKSQGGPNTRNSLRLFSAMMLLGIVSSLSFGFWAAVGNVLVYSMAIFAGYGILCFGRFHALGKK